MPLGLKHFTSVLLCSVLIWEGLRREWLHEGAVSGQKDGKDGRENVSHGGGWLVDQAVF
jgi:hypothetical protein